MRSHRPHFRHPMPVLLALALALVTISSTPAADKAWLKSWEQKKSPWRALHLIGPQPQRLDLTRQLITEFLVPMGFNVLILEVNFGFEYRSYPELNCHGLTPKQARELTDFCRKQGIRLIPLFNCLGHQSWAANTFALLKTFPQFDEAPHVPSSNKGIYCREWCPSHPDVNKVVFALLDELIEAFDADALHVGMDEVFLVGGGKCPRCQGKTAGQLFAQAVNDLHRHLAKKDVAMLMWADRLLDAARFSYGNWEASRTGSHTALSQIPKDIILCDWHYGQRQDYPSVRFFQQQGFRVLPATWNNPEAAVALIRNANREATDKMLGFLFTGWSAGGNGEYLLAGLKETKPVAGKPSRQQTGRQIAATLRLGVKELDRLAQPPRKEK